MHILCLKLVVAKRYRLAGFWRVFDIYFSCVLLGDAGLPKHRQQVGMSG